MRAIVPVTIKMRVLRIDFLNTRIFIVHLVCLFFRCSATHFFRFPYIEIDIAQIIKEIEVEESTLPLKMCSFIAVDNCY